MKTGTTCATWPPSSFFGLPSESSTKLQFYFDVLKKSGPKRDVKKRMISYDISATGQNLSKMPRVIVLPRAFSPRWPGLLCYLAHFRPVARVIAPPHAFRPLRLMLPNNARSYSGTVVRVCPNNYYINCQLAISTITMITHGPPGTALGPWHCMAPRAFSPPVPQSMAPHAFRPPIL